MAARPASTDIQTADQPKSRPRKKTASRQSWLAVVLAGLYVFFLYNTFGRIVLGLLAVALVIGIQMLIWHSDATAFFRMIGIELLVGLLIGWIWLLAHDLQADN